MDANELLLRARRARREAARSRAQAEANQRRLSAGLFSLQLEVGNDPAMTRAMMCGRRAGKTYFAPRWNADIGPGELACYVSVTLKQAKLTMWDEMRRVADMVGGKANSSDYTVRLPNDGLIVVGGCDDKRDVDRWRGFPKVKKWFVDECGAWDDLILRSFVMDVAQPAMVDVDGEMIMSGTPGLIPEGLWYELTGPESTQTAIPVHRWTMFDNPALPNAAAVAAKIREQNGWGEDHPTYLREYLGRWSTDESVLVYPWVQERNEVDRLPFIRTDPGWLWVLGVDVGYVDANAYVLWGAHHNDPDEYVVEAKKIPGQLIREMADEIRMYQRRFPGVVVVVDSGGMGKQHAEELQREHAIPVIPAEKTERLSAMRVVRDRLHSGRIRTLAGACDPLLSEWRKLRWNERRDDLEKNQEDHAADAARYGHRRLRHYLYEPRRHAPAYGSPEWAAAEEARMKAAAAKRGEKARRRKRWQI